MRSVGGTQQGFQHLQGLFLSRRLSLFEGVGQGPDTPEVFAILNPAIAPDVAQPGTASTPEDAEEGAPHGHAHAEARLHKLPKSRFPASVWRSADLCKQTQDGSDQQEGDVGLQEIEVATNLGAKMMQHQGCVTATPRDEVVMLPTPVSPWVNKAIGQMNRTHVAVQMQQTFRNGAIRQQLPWVHIGAPLARVHRAAGAQDLREGVRDERLH